MHPNDQKLVDKFNEVKDQIPFARLERNRDSQTLFGDILDWCRDYFNEPKNFPLGYMLLGYWHTEKEINKQILFDK